MNDNINRADRVKLALRAAINIIASLYTTKTTFSRESKLTVKALLRFLIGAEGGSLEKELRRAKIHVTRAAISQRRAQLPSEAFQKVFDKFNDYCDDLETYRDLKLLAVDGTSPSADV